jgi:hypothetical protein
MTAESGKRDQSAVRAERPMANGSEQQQTHVARHAVSMPSPPSVFASLLRIMMPFACTCVSHIPGIHLQGRAL